MTDISARILADKAPPTHFPLYENTPEQRLKVIRLACGNARDLADALQLLDVFDLLPTLGLPDHP